MFPDRFAIEVVTDQTVAAEENKQPLTVARGSGRCRTADGMRLFDARGHKGASPKDLPGALVEGDRGQFLQPGAVTSQKNSALVQDRRRVSWIQRHAPTQRVGGAKVVRQRSSARVCNSFGGTEIRRLCRTCGEGLG